MELGLMQTSFNPPSSKEGAASFQLTQAPQDSPACSIYTEWRARPTQAHPISCTFYQIPLLF